MTLAIDMANGRMYHISKHGMYLHEATRHCHNFKMEVASVATTQDYDAVVEVMGKYNITVSVFHFLLKSLKNLHLTNKCFFSCTCFPRIIGLTLLTLQKIVSFARVFLMIN